MTAVIWRILAAAIAVTFIYLILPPLLRLFGVSPGTDLLLIVKLCIAALALLYVVVGKWGGPPS